jgi:FMN hydrolase / 5-amino-6-(5-phospho-D-ribitylamino)uracil phosphatase
VLLLDVMDTLVRDPFYLEMPAFFGLTLDELLAQKDPRAWVDFETGAIDEETFYGRFFTDRRPIDGPGLKALARGGYRLLDGIEDLLDQLKGQGVPMHALSNYPSWYHEIESATGLSKWLDWSFVSCNLGLRKPDPHIYREVLRRLEQPASACVFVDDRRRNVVAAEAEGMTGILFKDAADLGARLLNLG